MKKQRIFVLYFIVLLLALLIVTSLGYLNYKNTAFEGLDKNKIYTASKKIKYANLDWYVLKQDDKSVTLILAKNATTNKYGEKTDYKNSFVFNYLNNKWIFLKDNNLLKNEISHGALVLDNKTNSFLRLVRIEELNDLLIKNDSKTPYWTMSKIDDKIIYILDNGYTEFTNYQEADSKTVICYKGNDKSSISDISMKNKTLILKTTHTLALPAAKKVTVRVTTEKEKNVCYSSYLLKNGSFTQAGLERTYISSWKILSEESEIGIRPVITVKKK